MELLECSPKGLEFDMKAYRKLISFRQRQDNSELGQNKEQVPNNCMVREFLTRNFKTDYVKKESMGFLE